MRFPSLCFSIIVLLLNTLPVFAQTIVSSDETEVRRSRIELLKSDISRDIETLKPSEQAIEYLALGDVLAKEEIGKSFKQKAVRIALDPATEFESGRQRFRLYRELLSVFWGKDEAVCEQILSKMKRFAFESEQADLDQAMKSEYARVAKFLIVRSNHTKTAFDFALLSLTQPQPANELLNDWNFFAQLRMKDRSLSGEFLKMLINTAQVNRDSAELELFYLNFRKFVFPESEKIVWKSPEVKLTGTSARLFVDVFISRVSEEAADLSSAKGDKCDWTVRLALKHRDSIKKEFPESSAILEKAISVCNNSSIPVWEKPSFRDRPQTTAGELLDRAKEIGDKKTREHYLKRAALAAANKDDLRGALDILALIDKESESEWNLWSVEWSTRLAKSFALKGDFEAFRKLLDDSPSKFRPFIILRSLTAVADGNPSPKSLPAIKSLLAEARNAFIGIDDFSDSFELNPAWFTNMTYLYLAFGWRDEAVTVHRETVDFFNRANGQMPDRLREFNPFITVAGNSLNEMDKFRTEFFSEIYADIARFEPRRSRIAARQNFLRAMLSPAPATAVSIRATEPF